MLRQEQKVGRKNMIVRLACRQVRNITLRDLVLLLAEQDSNSKLISTDL